MKILIAGDSWGVGVWQKPKVRSHFIKMGGFRVDQLGLIHQGLTYFLREKGHEIVNPSFSGATNLQIYDLIKTHNPDNFDYTFVYYTNPLRDLYKNFESADYKLNVDLLKELPVLEKYFNAEDRTLTIQDYMDMHSLLISHYKQKIEDLTYNKSLYYIGGHCKIPNFFSSSKKIKILFSSLREYFYQDYVHPESIYEFKMPKELLPKFDIQVLDRLKSEYDYYYNFPNIQREYFFPDGYHLNLKGHKILSDYLHDFMTQ